MPSTQAALHTNEKILAYIFIGLFITALFLKLGQQPLWMEEPRRAMVAVEMDIHQSYMTPSLYGEYYYNKPPVWNWMILIAFKLFGEHEFSVRFFSVVSFIGMVLLSWKLGSKYLSKEEGILSAVFLAISIDLLFYFSQLGEIDLFYSFISFGAIASIFVFAQRGQYYALFLSAYLLTAIGLLTKGLPSIAFLGISLIAFALYQKKWRWLFHPGHFLGILLMIGIIGSYLYAYNESHSLDLYLKRQFSESANRTAASKGIGDLLHHLIGFPLKSLQNLLPASFFLFFLLKKARWKSIMANPWIQFSLWMFISNYLLYWLSPGARQRYVYMLYPFAINILVAGWYSMYRQEAERDRYMEWIFTGLIALIAMASFSLAFLPFIPEPHWLIYSLPILAIGLGWLRTKYWQSIVQKTLVLGIAFAIARIGFNLGVFPHRSAKENRQQQEKVVAIEIAEMSKGERLYLFEDFDFPMRMTYYIESGRTDILTKNFRVDSSALYILNESSLPRQDFQLLYEFKDKNGCQYQIVKFNLD